MVHSPIFWAVLGADHTAFGKNFGSVLYVYVSNAFCFSLRDRIREIGMKKFMENAEI